MLKLRELLEKMIQMKASDLHLTAGLPPQYRVDGLIASSDYPVLTPDECTRLAYSVLNEEQKAPLRERTRARSLVRCLGPVTFSLQCVPAAWRRDHGSAPDSVPDHRATSS